MSHLIYTYNASAIALGGAVNNPSRTLIPSLASVALAPTGGLGTTVVTNYDRGGVMFDTAYSSVRGEQIAEHVYYTVAEVVIDNLTVFDTLHVDALRATVRSRRDLSHGDDAEITFHAEYSGLVVDGVEIAPELDLDLFETYPTYQKFLAEVTEDEPGGGGRKKAKDSYKARFEWADSDIPAPYEPTPKPLRASVAQLHGRPGYKLSIPKFGKIRLGEALLKPGRRRLSLLQIDFNNREGFPAPEGLEPPTGSSTIPDSGTMTIASVEGNGTPIWPKE